MNKFVNFGKRGVDLPAGCKDLIDVLRRAHGGKVTPHQTELHPIRKPTSHSVRGLANVARHLPSLWESAAKSKYLVIFWEQMGPLMNSVQLMNEKGVLTVATVIHGTAHRQQAIREVFKAAGLSPILDQAAYGGSVRVLRYPLPADKSSIGELVSALLRNGHGLPEDATLEIHFLENDAS
jgi:hypothetical protein